jgi:hypothetical protein
MTGVSGDLDVFIPEVWGERINDFLRSKLVLGAFFTNRSDELSGGGDTIHTPNMTEMTGASKSAATAVTLASPTETSVDLVVNTWWEVSFMIEDREAAFYKKSYALQTRYAKNAAFAAAKKMEVALAALFSGFSTSVGSSTTNIADSDVRAAIAAYEGNNNDPADGAFFFDTKVFWAQLQSIDKFSLAVNAPAQDPVSRRPQTSLYGYPTWLSNNIQYVSGTTGRYNALASSDALHFATASLGVNSKSSGMVGAMGVRVQSNYIPEYLGTLTTADILYGVIENRDAAGVAVLTPAS